MHTTFLGRKILKETNWSGDEKRKFRSSKVWKDFRHSEIQKRKLPGEKQARCECCGSQHPDKDFDLHHLEPDNYDNLDPTKFKLLDTKCHEFFEWIAIRLAADTKHGNFHRSDLFMQWGGGFLPKIVRKSDMYMKQIADTYRKNKSEDPVRMVDGRLTKDT